MKTFTTEEIRSLLNQVYNEEISFSQMVEVINKRVNETNEPQYKDGDFVINKAGSILIFREKIKDSIYDHAYFNELAGIITFSNGSSTTLIERHATEEEKKKMFNEIAKEGKRWNAEKKCIEDIPKRKFKSGDKVRIKDGVSSETHERVGPCFTSGMDKFIGKELTVKEYIDGGSVLFNEDYFEYCFHEDWLEPWSDEPKKGDLAIFWDKVKRHAIITFYERLDEDETCLRHKDIAGSGWENAIKFESKEQYEQFIKGEL